MTDRRHAEDVRGLAETLLIVWEIDRMQILTVEEREAHAGGLASVMQDAIDQYLVDLDLAVN